MSVLYIALPVALLIGGLAVWAFVHAVRQGQFDDLETPPMRMLFDDVDVRKDKPPASKHNQTGSQAPADQAPADQAPAAQQRQNDLASTDQTLSDDA